MGQFAASLWRTTRDMSSVADLQRQRNQIQPHIEALPDGFVKSAFVAALQAIESEIARVSSSTAAAPVPAPAPTLPPASATAAASSDPAESPEDDTMTGSAWGASVLAAVSTARVAVNSRFDAIALATHCSLLDAGFVCNGSAAEDKALAGFAPPAKGVRRKGCGKGRVRGTLLLAPVLFRLVELPSV